ncbi:hypothetical protein Slala03_49320 [Streptomyces lavendulae subsp. lavendulae]|nr:hypothetical protein Slala03_49320 [Streptomyces lavendulae subsp. lavendulae]
MSKPLIVITGAGSGIGAATARLLSARGHPLLLLARRLEKLQELALPETMCRKVDVTDRDALLDAVREAEERFGPADAIVNNAGAMLLGRIADQGAEEWDRMIDLNVKGQAGLRGMEDLGRRRPGPANGGRGHRLRLPPAAERHHPRNRPGRHGPGVLTTTRPNPGDAGAPPRPAQASSRTGSRIATHSTWCVIGKRSKTRRVRTL